MAIAPNEVATAKIWGGFLRAESTIIFVASQK
jgi:hypothetical protein